MYRQRLCSKRQFSSHDAAMNNRGILFIYFIYLLPQDLIDLTRVTYVNAEMAGKLHSALDALVETTQDFTDSAYMSHANRERMLLLTERLRHELGILLNTGACMVREIVESLQSKKLGFFLIIIFMSRVFVFVLNDSFIYYYFISLLLVLLLVFFIYFIFKPWSTHSQGGARS